MGVGEVGKGAAGYEYALTSCGGCLGHTRVDPRVARSSSKTPSATPQGARSTGTPSAAGPVGVAAGSASMPAPPGVSPSPRQALSPDWKKPQSHPLVHSVGTAGRFSHSQCGQACRRAMRGTTPWPTHHPGTGRSASGWCPHPCSNESRKQASHRNQRLRTPGFPR